MVRFIYKAAKRVNRRASTAIWLLLHLPFASLAPGASVARSVRVRPFWFTGNRLRIKLGPNATLFENILIQGSGELVVGESSFIGAFSVIGCNERVTIGANVMVAQAVSIRDTDHGSARTDIPMIAQGIVTSPVTIADDVWIGHGATILRGVTVGHGAIVAAGAVVNKDVPAMSIVGGVPARVLRTRATAEVIDPANSSE